MQEGLRADSVETAGGNFRGENMLLHTILKQPLAVCLTIIVRNIDFVGTDPEKCHTVCIFLDP